MIGIDVNFRQAFPAADDFGRQPGKLCRQRVTDKTDNIHRSRGVMTRPSAPMEWLLIRDGSAMRTY
ncbi:uncharacterized protein Dmul_07710 [Desulfococcus multivorans]|nr:uncharacterized protein Dmul_07710 [Desulfococcus multivorans]